MNANEFFDTLRADLKKAIETGGAAQNAIDPMAELKKSVDALQKSVDGILAALASPENGEPGAVTKAITDLQKSTVDIPVYGQTLEKVLERLERLEGHAAVRKSINGQDTDDADEQKKVQKAKDGDFGSVMRSLLANGKVKLT